MVVLLYDSYLLLSARSTYSTPHAGITTIHCHYTSSLVHVLYVKPTHVRVLNRRACANGCTTKSSTRYYRLAQSITTIAGSFAATRLHSVFYASLNDEKNLNSSDRLESIFHDPLHKPNTRTHHRLEIAIPSRYSHYSRYSRYSASPPHPL